jgi:hypothetical protein
MAKRTPTASRPGTARGASASSDRAGTAQSRRQRRSVAAVKAPFPWGVVALSVILGLLLVGTLGYAVNHQGSGFVTDLTKADASVPGVHVYDKLARQHVGGDVRYTQSPPAGGEHNGVPQTCQAYTQPVANEHAVHSMEHGAVWITYRPGLPTAEIAELIRLVQGNPYRLLSPYPGLTAPISLQAWGRQIFVDAPTDKRVAAFLAAYTAGPQAPEPGSPCQGTTATGPLSTQKP